MFGLPRRDPKKQIRFRRPEFQEKLLRARRYQRPPAGWGFRSRLLSLLLGFLGLVVIYFLTLSQMFLVQEAVLPESSALTSQEVEGVFTSLGQERTYFIPRNHILVLNRQSLLRALQKEFPKVRQITAFARVLPNKLKIAIEERKPLYIWQSADNFYLLDQDGVVFQKINNYSAAAFSEILIVDRSQAEIKVGQELEVQKTLAFVAELKDRWPQEITETTLVSFSLPALKSSDLFLETAIGFGVYFDLERQVLPQLRNLSLVLSQEIKSETYTGLSYIDLRLPNTAYYCYQDAPCAIPSSPSP